MKKANGQEGIALVITLLVMTILLIMGSAFMSISSTETLIAINERNRLQAYHVAEAGVEMAIARLNGDIAYVGSGGDQALGAGTYNVAVTCVPPAAPAPPCPPAEPPQRIVSATGCVRNCTSPVRATARVEMTIERRSQFPFGLLALDLVQFDTDNVQVDSYDSAVGPYDPLNPGGQGHIHSNGNFIFHGSNNTVKGNVQVVGSIQNNGTNNVITGSSSTAVSSESVFTDIMFPPPTGDLTVGDNQTVTLAPGAYSFNRITIGQNGRLVIDPPGQVTIYVAGEFYANTGAVINTSGVPTNLLIFSSRSGNDAVAFEIGTGEFYGGIYALNGEVEVRGHSAYPGWKFFGAIVSKEIDIETKTQFHYDVALSRSAGPAAKFKPLTGTWREVLN